MFEYAQNTDEASAVLRMALAEISRCNLPPTPVNVALFYERSLGRAPSLVQAMDAAINSDEGLSQKRAQEIFDEHLLHGMLSEITEAQQAVLRVLRGVMLQMMTTGNEFSSFAANLGDYVRKIDNSASLQDLRNFTQEVIQDTRTIEASSRDTSNRLSNASDEINRLREELEQARRDAMTDPLTGLANRRGFTDLLSRQIDEANKHAEKYTLLLADIDFFKHINDTYGHLVGDKILRFVARTLQSQVKGQDIVVRYGGEEFAIILPQTNYPGGLAVANKLRAKIAASRLRMAESGKEIGELTISIGVATHRAKDTPEGIIRRADDALMHAKREGRNRVIGQDDF
ncbi:MAG: GGDEF domain-containing protein [Halothiobacillaceae bacterium]